MLKGEKSSGNTNILTVIFSKIIPAIIMLYLVVYLIMFTLGVKKQYSNWHTLPGGVVDTLQYSAEEWSLIREKALLNARINLAGLDSIAMTINLTDSTVQLETKGVVLRQTKFEKVEISRFFKAFKPGAYAKIFSKPLNITEIEGSIVKEPITVKKAPRDSVEAAQNVVVTDSVKKEFVEWHLQLDSAFIVSFVQSGREFGETNWPTVKYQLRQHFKQLHRSNMELLNLNTPTWYPEITIYLPKNETKSIYRALPHNGKIVLKL